MSGEKSLHRIVFAGGPKDLHEGILSELTADYKLPQRHEDGQYSFAFYKLRSLGGRPEELYGDDGFKRYVYDYAGNSPKFPGIFG